MQGGPPNEWLKRSEIKKFETAHVESWFVSMEIH